MKTLLRLSATFAAFLLQMGTPFAEGVRHHIMGDADDTTRINLVILAEGYTASQENKFLTDLQTIADGVFKTTPYKEYASYFNVWGIYVISAEEGADCPPYWEKDTYFNVSISSDGLIALYNRDKVYERLAEHVPDYDIICVLTNVDIRAGMGGSIALTTACGSMVEVILHEIGHTFANLSDEYTSSRGSYQRPYEAINVTAHTPRDSIRWNAWIMPQTPVPTPEDDPQYYNAVGLFEGAGYTEIGWYRPKFSCRMNNEFHQFCEVCIEAHVSRVYSIVKPVIAKTPAQDTITYTNGSALELSVQTFHPTPNTMHVRWGFNGSDIGEGERLDVSTLSLSQTYNTLTATAVDSTPLVRIASNKPGLQQSVSWVVRYLPTAAGPLVAVATSQYRCSFGGSNRIRISGTSAGGQTLDVAVYTAAGALIGHVAKRVVALGDFAFNVPVSAMAHGIYFVKLSDASAEHVYRIFTAAD